MIFDIELEKKNLFQLVHVLLSLTQTRLFTERVAPGASSSKYGSKIEISPPPLLFSHPWLSTREGQEC